MISIRKSKLSEDNQNICQLCLRLTLCRLAEEPMHFETLIDMKGRYLHLWAVIGIELPLLADD